MSWQLQNKSREKREFQLYLTGNQSPQLKIVPANTSVTMPGLKGLTIIDCHTRQAVNNPANRNMWITPEGYLLMR